MKKTECPLCQADLTGEPIPDKYFVHRDDCPKAEQGRCFCLPYGEKDPDERFFSRTIMVEVRGVYDGGLYFQCPDCHGAWHRWDSLDMRRKAQPYIDEANRRARDDTDV